MRDGLKDADIVMMLRLQRERMTSNLVPSQREYFHFFGLDHEKLACAKPDALIMHPGPMNRGVEIDSSVADDARSVIREQVEMGVAVRMAVLQALARHLPESVMTMQSRRPRSQRPHGAAQCAADRSRHRPRRDWRPADRGRQDRRSRPGGHCRLGW